MVHDPRVSHQLSRLGGVYRDPARVDRDAASLLKSSVGTHLQPIISSLTSDSGSQQQNVLVLQGTIAIHFRGNTYQLLVDIYLPAGYPRRPPVCFVRLATPNMYLKDNHRHVGSDGKVYLPYLHEWNRNTHNLIELVVAMSSVFSADPPVFTRAAAATQPPPPTQGASPAVATPASPPRSGNANWQTASEREALLAIEAAEANEAAAAARRAEQEEQERERQRQADLRKKREQEQARSRQKQYELQKRNQIQQQVNQRVVDYLHKQRADVLQQATSDARDGQRLELAQQKIERETARLQEEKQELTKQVATVDTYIGDIQEWIRDEEQAAAKQQTQQVQQLSIDDQVTPSNAIFAQMLELSAENASISDALYFLDKALYRGNVDCAAHLRLVRKLAKRQFLVRAHLLKIAQQKALPTV